MKKLLYIFASITLIILVLNKNANASFFDDLINLLKNKTTPITNVQNQTPVVVPQNTQNTTQKLTYFTRELEVGSENVEVKNLQQFLCKKGFYKECLITGYFGPLTKKAVMNFQSYYANEVLKPVGLVRATGYVGQATIKKLNSLVDDESIQTNVSDNQNVFSTSSFDNYTNDSTTTSTSTSTTTTTTTILKSDYDKTNEGDNASACIINLLEEVSNQTCSTNSDCMVVDHYCVNKTNTTYKSYWEKAYTKVSKAICSNSNVNLPFIDHGDRCECVTNRCMPMNDYTKPSFCGNGFCDYLENRELLYRWAEPRIINGVSVLYPISPKENNLYCEQDCKQTTTNVARRYSCSAGKCIENPNGAFTNWTCDGMCTSSLRYACNILGKCVLTTGGPYNTDNCDNECVMPTKNLLEEIYYDKTKARFRCSCIQDKVGETGDYHYATLSEDQLSYPALRIKSPVSYKSYLTVNKNNFPVLDFYKKRSGWEIITNINDLTKFFTVSDSSVFSEEFFEKNILVFAYDGGWDTVADSRCSTKIIDFKIDRVVYNAPDLDEIYNTDDNTPYNYKLSKYYQIIVKAATYQIVDNKGACALKCLTGQKYNFDVVAITKEDLKKPDGSDKKVIVEGESVSRWCIY